MRFRHRGKTPVVDPSAYVAPNAVLCGDVRIGPGCAIAFGAVLSAEDGSIELGRDCIVMENAVVKATQTAPVRVGNNVLIGPHAYLTGCTIENEVFLATGTTIFNHAVIGARAEVRINATVHLSSRLAPNAIVPVGWVAVGDPAEILSPDQHERIWEIQKPLNFPKVVFGLDRPPEGGTIMPEITRRYAMHLRAHRADQRLD
ncbi:MAG: gamma carbonic anhydrase family protein [Rhodospirillales bacterium]|nr:gamma carbonic anhydrase family protein [Rhodospirillales bacterium]